MNSIKTIQDLADFEDWLHQQAGGILPEQLTGRYEAAINDLIPLAEKGLKVKVGKCFTLNEIRTAFATVGENSDLRAMASLIGGAVVAELLKKEAP
jgi:hypothetical protein